MSSKVSPVHIISAHFATFTDINDRKRLLDWVEMVVLPLALGGACVYFTVQARQLVAVISGISILTGLLFGLLVYLFSLRLQLAADPRVDPRNRSVKLVSQLFSNVAYAVFFGLCATVFVIVALNAASTTKDGGTYLTRFWTGAVVAVGAHLFLTIVMCVKRTGTAFSELQKVPPAPAVPAKGSDQDAPSSTGMAPSDETNEVFPR